MMGRACLIAAQLYEEAFGSDPKGVTDSVAEEAVLFLRRGGLAS